jgi:hypothetical protein
MFKQNERYARACISMKSLVLDKQELGNSIVQG